MKKAILLIIGIIVAIGAYANRDTGIHETNQSERSYSADSSLNNLSDGFMMKDRKMVSINNGSIMAMEKDITLPDGSIVSSTGLYLNKDGTSTMLKEGEHIDLSGTVTSTDKSMDIMKGKTPGDNIHVLPGTLKNKSGIE